MIDAHPPTEGLLRLIRGEATEDDAEALYAHVAACALCERRLLGFRALAGDPDRAFDALAPLSPDETAPPRPGPASGEGFRFVALVDAARSVASVALEAAGEGLGGRLALAYEGVAAIEGSAGPSLEAAAEALSAHDLDAARIHLEVAARIDPRATAAADLELLHDGRPVGRIRVEADRRAVTAIVRSDAAIPAARLVVSTDGFRLDADFVPVAGAGQVRAEVLGVPSGALRIAIEPATG